MGIFLKDEIGTVCLVLAYRQNCRIALTSSVVVVVAFQCYEPAIRLNVEDAQGILKLLLARSQVAGACWWSRSRLGSLGNLALSGIISIGGLMGLKFVILIFL